MERVSGGVGEVFLGCWEGVGGVSEGDRWCSGVVRGILGGVGECWEC